MKLVAKVDIQALPAPIHEAYFKYIQSFWDHGELDPQIKELVRMRSAINADCKQWKISRTAEGQRAGLTNEKISKAADFENSDLSEREKMALRFADFLKYNPQGVDDDFLVELKSHFSDAEITEIGFFMGAYGGAHNLFSAVKERVFDDDGNDISDSDGFPVVFDTHEAVTRWQSEEEARRDGPLPRNAASDDGAHAHRPGGGG